MGIDDHSKLEEKVVEFERAQKVLELLMRTNNVPQHVKDVMKLNSVIKKYKGDRFNASILAKGITDYLKIMKVVDDAVLESLGSKKGQTFMRAIKLKASPIQLELSRAHTTKESFSDEELALLTIIQENLMCLLRPATGTCDVSVDVTTLNPHNSIPVIAVDANLQCEKLWARSKSKTVKIKRFYETDYITKTVGFLKKEFFYLAKAFVSSGVYPIFVFDGKAPPEKSAKYERYKKVNERADIRLEKCNKSIADSAELDIPVADFMMEEKRKLFMQMERIPKAVINELKLLVKSMGLPVLQVDGEADPYCVFLERIGVADAVYTTDSDVLVHGAKYRFKNFSSVFISEDTAKGIKPHVSIQMHGTSLERLLEASKLTHDQYLDLCILAQCDYNTKVKGYGMITAYKDMLELGSLERILKERLADKDTSGLNIEACRRLFRRKAYKLNPEDLYASSTILETSGIEYLSELGLGEEAATLLLNIEVLEERAKLIVVPPSDTLEDLRQSNTS